MGCFQITFDVCPHVFRRLDRGVVRLLVGIVETAIATGIGGAAAIVATAIVTRAGIA